MTILTNLPPENRELFLISELRKIKNPFSLFRQRAENFQISTIWVNALHWHMQNKFCLSKIGMARQYCISLEKENYNDIGTPLEFLRKTTSGSRRCCNVNVRSENRRRKHDVVTTLVFRRSNDVGSTTLWQHCDNVIRRRDQNTTKT